MAEFNTTESLNQAPKIDSVVSIRCAKVARLLSDLRFPSPDVDESAKKEITAELKRELKKLKIQLLKEREKNKKVRFDRVVELCIWICIFFCLWNICLFLFFDLRLVY
ncbi:hypothetical protein M9H77_32002 [Catharanthus roseus]|uniref:Uncharacterized protein n=1 Tax=Catharanthus roseus TaxID=4058 RepID=A0ACC0A3I0_CATRO|nr:hypothetical protein M9H77_32002 [Catharanthus roseus]